MEHVTALAKVPIFAHVSPPDLEALAAQLRRRRYRAGESVFLMGDPGTNLCIVDFGCVKIALASPDGREMILDLMGPGDAFGELALLDGEPRSADAVATEPTELLLLTRDDFLHFLEIHPRIAIDLLEAISKRLRLDVQLVQDSAFLDVPGRLAKVLLRLGRYEDRGQPCTARLTQSDLAGLVGTTRQTVNQWLGHYEDRGVIRRERGRIIILKPAELRQRIY